MGGRSAGLSRAKDPLFTAVEVLLAAAATRPIAIADLPQAATPEVESAVLIFLVNGAICLTR